MPTEEHHSPRVAEASRMVAAQADCTVDEAVVLMETRAVSTHGTLEQIATGVLDNEIRFGSTGADRP